jgi:hypothetical protein
MRAGDWIGTIWQEPQQVTRRMLWLGLWGGGVAWLAHLLLCWVIAEFGCISLFRQYYLLGLTGISWLIFLVSGLAVLGAAYPTVLAWRVETRLRQSGKVEGEDANDLFVARAGWITSGLFLLVIVVQIIPIFFYLKEC